MSVSSSWELLSFYLFFSFLSWLLNCYGSHCLQTSHLGQLGPFQGLDSLAHLQVFTLSVTLCFHAFQSNTHLWPSCLTPQHPGLSRTPTCAQRGVEHLHFVSLYHSSNGKMRQTAFELWPQDTFSFKIRKATVMKYFSYIFSTSHTATL